MHAWTCRFASARDNTLRNAESQFYLPPPKAFQREPRVGPPGRVVRSMARRVRRKRSSGPQV